MLYNICRGIYKFGNNTYPRRIRRRSNLGHIFRGGGEMRLMGQEIGKYRKTHKQEESWLLNKAIGNVFSENVTPQGSHETNKAHCSEWTRLAESTQRLVTGWMVRGSNCGGGGKFFRTRPDRPWGPGRFLYLAGAWRAGRGVDHPP